MADDDPQGYAVLAHQRRQAQADGFHTKEIDFVWKEPACVVFAKARGLDEREALEGKAQALAAATLDSGSSDPKQRW